MKEQKGPLLALLVVVGLLTVAHRASQYDLVSSLSVTDRVAVSEDNGTGFQSRSFTMATLTDFLFLESSAPPAGTDPPFYIDTDTNELCFHNGTSWVGISAGGACAAAAAQNWTDSASSAWTDSASSNWQDG